MAQTYIFGDKYFKQRLIDFKLEDIPQIEEKRKVIARYMLSLNSGRIERTKEEAIQADFLNNFFGDVLGYDYKDAKKWNLAKEHKSETDTTKADGALGFFTLSDNGIKADVRVVIELKDALTELDKSQNRLNDKRTPVEQAFSYSSKAGGKCKWVIVSNFKEIRLYHATDQGNYEKFVLAELSKDDNLKRFFYILQKEHLISETSESPIEKLYRERQEIEQNITKKFYNTYKTLRIALFEHLKEQNNAKEELLLFNKAQKILDRLTFVCFAEDKNLLPPYTLHKVKETNKIFFDFEPNKIWRQLKGLFHSIDMGNPPMNISKFNGGLFAKDDALDDLVILDDMLLRLVEISEFDFESELNVNILGHIFEQSLSDIEEIKAQIGNGKDLSKDEKAEVKKNGKRKKEGIFYTPEYITRYIVKEAVGGWLDDRKKELGFYNLPELTSEDLQSIKIEKKKNKKTGKFEETLTTNTVVTSYITFWEAYRDKLRHIKVLDPACGSGAFLNQAFDYLYAEGQAVNDQLSALRLGQRELFELDKHILTNNIFGVDLNPESVEITKLSLWLKTANKGKELTALDDNIKCGNSLIDDKTIAGDRAFNWFEEFPQVFPHYRRPKAEIPKEEPEPGDKDYLDEVQDPSYSYKENSKGFGKYGFDVVIGNPPYGAFFTDLEKEFIARFKTFKYRFESYVYFFEKGINITKRGGYIGYITPELWLSLESCEPLRKLIFSTTDLVEINVIGENVFSEAVVNTIITIICKEKKRTDYNVIYKGIKSNYPYDLWKQSPVYKIEYRINFLEQKIIERIEKNSTGLINFGEVIQGITPYDKYRGQDSELIKRRGFHYTFKKDDTCGKWLSGEDINRYSEIWSGEWLSYGDWLAAPREKRFFEGSRLLFREIPGKNRRIQAVITEDISYYGHSITPFILFERRNIVLLKKILCLVNSRLMSWYGNIKLPNFGKEIFPKLNPQDIKLLPIHNETITTNNGLGEKADQMLSLNKELFELSQKFQRSIQRKFNLEVLPGKLQDWYLLSYAEFIQELGKKKINLALKEEAEWEDYFLQESQKALELKNQIERTDKEIDRMVYKIYGLTLEEIKIIDPDFNENEK